MSLDPLSLLIERSSMDSLVEPAPDKALLEKILTAGLSAPDHGRMRPWRWAVVTGAARADLAKAVERATLRTQPDILESKLRRRNNRFSKTPLIIALGAALTEGRIPLDEQRASVACAAMNILNGLYMKGFGAIWISGEFCRDKDLMNALGLNEGKAELEGFLLVGTPEGGKIPSKTRPKLEAHVRYFTESLAQD